MQTVKFPIIANVESGKYLEAAIKILAKLHDEQPKERVMKRWMRAQGYLDKESFPLLEELLDFNMKSGKLGKVGKKFLESNEETRQDMIFERIAGQNEILIKYVFDAIQERLYSTSELYRMLTSYVYPGTYIDLPDFTIWLHWMNVSGRIRVLGIRWAPGKRFEDSASYLRSIDVDDILEEEAEEELLAAEEKEAQDAEGGAEAESAKSDGPAEPEPAVAEPEPESDDDDDDDGEGWESPDDFPDEDDDSVSDQASGQTAPSADTGQLQAIVQALAGGAGSATLIDARLLDPIPQASALAAGVPLQRVKEALDAEESPPDDADISTWPGRLSPSKDQMAENVRTLLEWWGGIDDRRTLRADQYGLMPYGEAGWQEGTKSKFLFKLACLGVSLLRQPDVGEVAFSILESSNFYDQLFDKPGSVEQLLDELFEQGLGNRVDVLKDLHLILMLARSLRGAEKWCSELDKLSGEEVIEGLWKRLAAFNLDAECLWIVREMALFGLLRHESLPAVRVVPTEEARLAAFHLGLLDTSRAASLPALLHASRRLTPLLAMELEAPLIHLWRCYGAHPPARFWSR